MDLLRNLPQTAQADDDALLRLVHEAPTIELKLAAIEAMAQEEGAKRAMRELREGDKRLYRAAKSRWEAISGKRKSTARAHELIAEARALLEQEFPPVNRAVELDRAWSALPAELLEAELRDEFAALSAGLGARVRERGEGEQALTRWLAAADEAIGRLRASLAGVAQGDLPPDAAQSLAAALLELLGGVPDAKDARCLEKTDAANRALALASSVVQRAEFLLALPASGVADDAGDKARIAEWRDIPEVPEAGLQEVLAERFGAWRNASLEERRLAHDARRARERERIEADVKAAEAALAAGQVAELARLMAPIERALKRGAPNAALGRRVAALHAGLSRLRDWQRWSGRQGREQLLAEAQVLKRAAAGNAALKAHAEAIDKLRSRWKELDKLGAPASQGLWHAFDGALKAAYAPVAAHLEKLKAAREQNLAARNRIIDELAQAAAKDLPVSGWRAIAHALQDAEIGWRKLGPVEHTVPRKAQHGEKGVIARYAAARQALEAPLKEAWRQAIGERERLVAAAKQLAGSGARDTIDKVRALQTQWQAQAKGLVLPRRDESALWSAFKAATDAVFAERDATRHAKEAEFKARVKAREEAAAREAEAKRQRVERAAAALHTRFDALSAAVALCQEVESAEAPPADLEARWSALRDLPKDWKTKLEARLRGNSAKSGESLGDLLLKLEMACGIDSPPEFAAQRQRLKLLALKQAMESRRPAASTPQDLEGWLLDAAAAPRPDDSSRARLAAIIAATRQRQPRIT